MPEGKIQPLNEGGLDRLPKSIGRQHLEQLTAFAPRHAPDCIGQPTSLSPFHQLRVAEVFVRLPMVGPGTGRAQPVPKVSGQA
jgi:hypothetical protein